MFYLDPKSDIIFKKLFGSDAHKNILISFLNCVLQATQEKKIIDVFINDPHNLPENLTGKRSIVDVRCTDEAGKQYIVEMQVVTQKDFTQRAQYYASVGIHRQLNAREEYQKILPVIFVGILDFSLLQTSDYISHHRTLDIKNHNCEFKLTEYHIIELPKFEKEISSMSDYLDKWIYFLKNATDFQSVPHELNMPVLNDAFQVLSHANLTQEELAAYDKYLDDIRCYSSQLLTAHQEGQDHAKKAIALELLDILDTQTIAKKTGLTVEEVQALAKRENR